MGQGGSARCAHPLMLSQPCVLHTLCVGQFYPFAIHESRVLISHQLNRGSGSFKTRGPNLCVDRELQKSTWGLNYCYNHTPSIRELFA